MVKIRLLRMGRHKAPTFRLVAVDSKAKANGSYIELIGNYNPQRAESSVNEYNAIKWLARGAQPTDTAKNLLQKAGIWSKFVELKNNKKLEEYLGETPKKEPVVKKEKPKKQEKPVVKKEEPKKVEVKEEPKEEIVEEVVEEIIEEPVIIEEDEEDEEDDVVVEEEAPEIETIVEEEVEEEIILTKAINEVVPENGIVPELVRVLDETTVSLTAKNRKESNYLVKLPAISNYEINREAPTKVEFSLETATTDWAIQKNSLVAKKLAILEPVTLKVLVTLWRNDNKLSFYLTIIINPADEKEEGIKIAQESNLVTVIDEKELKAREKQTLTAITSAELKKSGEKPEIIIVSMHHKIIEEIINQEKTTLFTKRLPASTVSRALIYCVKPIGTVIGEFTLKSVAKLPKAEAWEKYGSKSALTKAEFNNYYHGKALARVMIIDGFIQYKEPKLLSSLDINRGPSGFRYLRKLGK